MDVCVSWGNKLWEEEGTGNGEGEVEVRSCGVLQWFTRQVGGEEDEVEVVNLGFDQGGNKIRGKVFYLWDWAW